MKKGRTRYRIMAPLIGITGGIGSGKSLAANVFKKLGSYLIDADEVGRQIIENDSSVKKKVVQVFGSGIVKSDGTINRKELASIVFTDQMKLKIFNNIIHPPMIRAIKEEFSEAMRSRQYPMIAVDAAIIFEAGVDSFFDSIITVTASIENRVQWLQNRGLKRQEAYTRMSSQMPEEEKTSRSDYVLENNSTIKKLEEEAEILFHNILLKFGTTLE